ncbi:hypothetical protein GCM10028895_42190 [Pontibacter rugosus]
MFSCQNGIELLMKNHTLEQFLKDLFLSSATDDDGPELIPIITADVEDDIKLEDLPDELPLLAVRNTVLFPGVVLPITVSRKKSVKRCVKRITVIRL